MADPLIIARNAVLTDSSIANFSRPCDSERRRFIESRTVLLYSPRSIRLWLSTAPALLYFLARSLVAVWP